MSTKKHNPAGGSVAPGGDVKLRAVASVSVLGHHSGVLDDDLYELLSSDERDLKTR
ncbi:hypothetical protein [Shimia sp.]|uniref:hypothetical protein n=1 Tax=Shimia sp. TaxID=1954381 RepID=UPI003B8D32DB